MKNKIIKKIFILSTITIGMSSFAPIASADLYISPVLRDSIVVDSNLNKQLSNKKDGSVVVGESSSHGRFIMQEKSESSKKPFANGSNVPLFYAIEANIPENEGWIVHIEDNIKNKPVSWEDESGSWEGTLKTIGKQNNFHIVINPVEKSIGISSDEKIAFHMAKRIPQVWNLEEGKSLKENLGAWADKSGWNLQWHEDLTVDYKISHNAIFTGSFIGEGGVVSQVLTAMKDANVPLKAEFYTKNNVLLIKESGFDQEVKY